MLKASRSKYGLSIMWLSSALQLARGFTSINRCNRLTFGAFEATSTKALFSLSSHNNALASVDDVPNMLGIILAEGGTDLAADFLASAFLKEPDSLVTVSVLDKLSAASWVDVVQKASGIDKENGSGAGKASSCFNALLSELGRSRSQEAHSELEESISESRAELAVAVLDEMRKPKNGCLPDVVTFSAAACACVAAGKSDKANEVLSLASAASGRRPGEKRVRVRRQPTQRRPKKEDVQGGHIILDEGVRIAFEDDHVIVAFKPPGLLVHRVEGTPTKEKSLCEIVASSGRPLSSLGPSHAAGVTHRLDKGTSGLIVLTKTNLAHAALVMTFFRRLVSKSYLALTTAAQASSDGNGSETTRGRIDLPLDGRPAISEWELVSTLYGDAASTPIASLVKVKTLTGRKHQVLKRRSYY